VTLLEGEAPDLLLADLKMPGMDGLELLRRARGVDHTIPVIIVTGFATIESAVAAVKAGAFDYLPKNFSIDQLTVAVERALRQRRLQIENRNLRAQLHGTLGLENIVGPRHGRGLRAGQEGRALGGEHPGAGRVGTGKELIARAVHANSPRATEAFVPVDCASLPEQLLESELFGHEKGAFTGAVRTKPGLMEVAHRGTMFLDEIGELPLGLQVKLLRALQERQIRRVGGTSFVNVDVRVVSATNRALREAIAKGTFREELYYRINVIAIHLPPLRERAGDVRLLAHAFLRKYGRDTRLAFDDEAMLALESYRWPGNVRELENIVERACALADGTVITRRDLPQHVLSASASSGPMPADMSSDDIAADVPLRIAKERWMQRLEASYLRELLDRHDGNISAAARTAGNDRKTFHRLINKYQLK
jgi:DNA-binding NtrC family response regulator